jgi:hypothetical protein
MMPTIGRRSLVWPVLVALLLAGTPAAAYDDLESVLPALPIVGGDGPVFSYAERTLTGRKKQALTVGGAELILALARPERSLRLTGIDLAQVESVFVTGDANGDPAWPVIILNGRDGFAAGAEAALVQRGFVRTNAANAAGSAAYAFGPDNTTEASSANSADPFAGERGRSQRLAVQADRVVAASATADLDRALSVLSDRPPCAVCDRFRRITDTIRSTAGADTRLKDVQGYLVSAFVVPRQPPPAPLESEADFQQMSARITGPPLSMPLFDVALIGELETKSGTRLLIGLSYRDRKAAERGIAEVAKRLKTGRSSVRGVATAVTPPTQVDTTVVDRPGGVVALALVTFPGGAPSGIVSVFQRWTLEIASRDFYVLDVLK